MVRDAMRRGARRVVLVLPTGTGKTRTASDGIARPAVERGRRVLWLAHRRELVDQACATLADRGLRVGAISATATWRSDPDAPVQVASIQTLLARDARPRADLIIADECHHLGDGAETWRALLESWGQTPMVGLTATPERGDGGALGSVWQHLVVGITVREATERGILVPCEIIRPERMLARGIIAQHPVDAYVTHARGTRAILFARSVHEAERYRDDFRARGIRAELVEAGTPPAERSAILDLFRRGDVSVVCNVYVLTEGTDIPSAETCILARGASSAGIYLQMVGRVIRYAPGKSSALLIDLRGVSHVHGAPEDERVYSLDGRGISRARDTPLCPVCSSPRDPGEGCASCGWRPDEREDRPTRVSGDPLVRYARMIAQSPEQRWETLLRWMRRAVAERKNPKSLFHKWRAVYQERLPSHIYMRALRIVMEEDHATRQQRDGTHA